MALIDLSPPAVEPVDLAYAKTFLRVDTPDEDTLITDMISTARAQVENIIGRTLIKRGFLYRGDTPSSTCVSLPRPPLISVTRLSLISEQGMITDILPENYIVNTRNEPGEIQLVAGTHWSDHQTQNIGIEIEFFAGYGETATDIPLPIKQAILLLLAQNFEHRDAVDKPTLPLMVDALLMPYREVRL
ncbi:MAG TPA: hypothetical protein ENJ46_00510 [Hellea balneolensis]|uniref:Phage gp6-like head-tail connector protein n=1 Tax=Hellea balneolensis TaxID=287478 RepID=A0A7C3GBD3_9PROT|nr:hypothetical protein [Hellea balneolensis]